MPPVTVASAYSALARVTEMETTWYAAHASRTAWEAVQTAAIMRDDAFFKLENQPPVLMHASGASNANCLYGGTRTSPVLDAAYRPGKSDLRGQRRHERQLVGAAFLEAGTIQQIPVLLYLSRHERPAGEDGEDGEDGSPSSPATLVAHVFSAPLAQLEAQLGDDGASATPMERALYGGEATAEHQRHLRVQACEYMREGGLASLPGFLVQGDYHLTRPGLVSMLRLRGPESDLELEMLETVCMTALQHHLNGLAGEDCLGPSPILSEDEPLVADDFLTVFDSCEDEFEYLNYATEQAMNEFHHRERDYKQGRWADASKLARRQVAVTVAAALLAHGPAHPKVSPEEIGKLTTMAARSALEEASEMARSAYRKWLSRSKRSRDMSELMGMCPGASRLRYMAPNAVGSEFLREMTNQVFEGAVDAELASREVDCCGTEEDTVESRRVEGTNTIERVARRVAEPNAMLCVRLSLGQTIQSIKLVSCCTYFEKVTLEDAARLLSFPWVVPVAVNTSGADNPRGLVTIEQPRVRRDKLRVTEEVRLRFGATPKPAASPDDLNAFKREVNEKMQGVAHQIGALTEALKTRPVPAPELRPAAREPCAVSKTLRETVDVLEGMMKKRRMSALTPHP